MSLFDPQRRWTTIGATGLVALAAFDALALTTVMPAVVRDLHGEALYSAAFAGALAANTFGTVAGGGWADRRGPLRPLLGGVAVFLTGLVISASAGSMGLFLLGRVLQGLGSGAMDVSLFVVVARLYPSVLHPRIFGLFASAWIVPSLLGPPIAGVVADTLGWHWVFVGIAVLVLLAAAALLPARRALRATHVDVPERDGARRRLLWAVLLAAAVLTISLSADAQGPWMIPVVIVALTVAGVAARSLLPKGTLRARRGLPSLILLRGLVAGAFFTTESYLPYLLHDRYGLPSAASGLVLTVAALSWAATSQLQARLPRMSHATSLRIGTALLLVGTAVQLITVVVALSPLVAAAGWVVAGAGMGLIYPRLNTLVLGHAPEGDEGGTSAALAISDTSGSATAVAVAGLLFVGAGGSPLQSAFAVVMGFTTLVAAVAAPVVMRSRTPV